MKAYVYVSLKKSVLDPQGKTIHGALKKMGYKMSFGNRTSGPINAIYLDSRHGSLWGGSSNNGEDYGIGW